MSNEAGYLGNDCSCLLGVSQAYSRLPWVYCLNKSLFIRGTSKRASQNFNKTQYIYFDLSGHHQELHETEKYRIFWGVFNEGGGPLI